MRTDGCAQVSAPASTRREARLLVPEAAEYACNGGAGALRGAGDALGRARACRGVLDVLDRLGDVGGDDLHLGHLLLSHVCCEPDLAERALLGQHILGVEPGGARGEGERSGGWRGPGCAAARARGWARAHICPCKRQAQSLHLPRSAEKRYDNERTCVPHSPGCLRPPPLVFSVYPFLRSAPRLCFGKLYFSMSSNECRPRVPPPRACRTAQPRRVAQPPGVGVQRLVRGDRGPANGGWALGRPCGRPT